MKGDSLGSPHQSRLSSQAFILNLVLLIDWWERPARTRGGGFQFADHLLDGGGRSDAPRLVMRTSHPPGKMEAKSKTACAVPCCVSSKYR